jgi:hypothetical protein
MRREELAHILRAAAKIVEDPEILVIGSQSILGTYWEDELPAEAWVSIEADVAFFDDPDEDKALMVDGSIGELSPFHETHAYYAQGVSVSTAILPSGWRDRLVPFDSDSALPATAMCLNPHDLVDVDTLLDRAAGLPDEHGIARAAVVEWLHGTRRRLRGTR